MRNSRDREIAGNFIVAFADLICSAINTEIVNFVKENEKNNKDWPYLFSLGGTLKYYFDLLDDIFVCDTNESRMIKRKVNSFIYDSIRSLAASCRTFFNKHLYFGIYIDFSSGIDGCHNLLISKHREDIQSYAEELSSNDNPSFHQNENEIDVIEDSFVL